MYQLLTHGIGFLSTALQVGCFQCKSSRKLIFVQFAANFAFLIHLLLLGAYSGCINVLLSCVRNLLVNSRRPWTDWNGWLWLLVVANVVGTAITWQNLFSVLPCIAVVSLTIATWSCNGKKIRLANLFSASPAWLIYNIYSGSYSGVVTELFCLGSVVISVVRYGWKALDNTD